MWRTSRRGGWLPVAALGLAVLAMVVSGCLSGVTLTTSTLATPAIPAAEARAPNASLSDYPLLNIGAQHSTVLKGLIAEATPQQLALVESRAQAMLDKATSDPAAAVGSGLDARGRLHPRHDRANRDGGHRGRRPGWMRCHLRSRVHRGAHRGRNSAARRGPL